MIGENGAQHLARVFENNKVNLILTFSPLCTSHFLTQTLTALYLENNRIGAEGAHHLARGFGNNLVSIGFFSFVSSLLDIDAHYTKPKK